MAEMLPEAARTQMTHAAARLFTMVILLASCGSGAPAGDPPNSGAESRDSVVAVVARLTDAVVARDVDAFSALWERSDSVVYSRHGHTFVGWDEIRAEHERAFSMAPPWTVETGAVYARTLGPSAGVVTSFQRISPLSSPDAGSWFITTFTVEASDGVWRIVQAHGSYPDSARTPRGDPDR
jgi:uncharacterized protein (TIGR02246 family)